MITSFIKKYILPKEVDFLSAMHTHAEIIKKSTDDLYACFIQSQEKHCLAIIKDQHEAQKIRDKNMKELLNTFITPVDRESIYRVITQLDWIAISIRHFTIETNAYGIKNLDHDYAQMIQHIQLQAELLTAGFKTIKSNPNKTAQSAKRVRDTYDALVDIYIKKMASVLQLNDMKNMFIHKELLFQLKDISKHMRMSANSLEDIVMKMS